MASDQNAFLAPAQNVENVAKKYFAKPSKAEKSLGRILRLQNTDSSDLTILTAAQLRQDLFQTAKFLLPHEQKLQKCLAGIAKSDKPVSGQYAANVNRARLGNLILCNYALLCPNCGARIAEVKKFIAQTDVAAWESEGFTVCAVVLTIQHVKEEPLEAVDRRIDKAFYELLHGRDGKAFVDKWRLAGRLRSPDCTNTEANGWHTHRNLILFLEERSLTEARQAEFADEFKALWVKYCAAVGGYATFERGCVVSFDRVFDFADYMASKAMGCGYAGTDKRKDKGSQKWGAAEELTKTQYKTVSEGKTPSDMLNAYMVHSTLAAVSQAVGDTDGAVLSQQEADLNAQLWQEYAAVFGHKKFLDTKPNGFRKRIDALKAKHANALGLEKPNPEWADIFYPGPAALRQIFEYHIQFVIRATLRRVKGDPVKMREFFQEWGIDQVYYPTLDSEYPDWWIAPEGTSPEIIAGIREFNRFVADWNNSPVTGPGLVTETKTAGKKPAVVRHEKGGTGERRTSLGSIFPATPLRIHQRHLDKRCACSGYWTQFPPVTSDTTLNIEHRKSRK